MEAAIDYSHMRASLEPEDKRKECQLKLLKRVKEEFSSSVGLWSKEYQSSRALHPQKERIYDAYMKLIDAHILRLEGENGTETGKHSQNAIALYRFLLQDEFATFNYLIEQAKSGLATLEK